MPCLKVPLVADGVASRPLEVNAPELTEALAGGKIEKDAKKELSKKYKVDSGKKNRRATLPRILTRCCL